MTKLEQVDWESLTDEQMKQFYSDERRQIKILKNEGFSGESCARLFYPQIDPKTNECIAILLDFGELKKLPKEKQRNT